MQFKVLEQTAQHIQLRIAVRDSGIGIAAENLVHIFDGFSQAEASTTRRFGGSGLGLSICKRLVELMGGALQIDSALDDGSTFHFSVRLDIADEVPGDPKPSQQRPISPLHVLVVDDNAVACELLASMAESWGWKADKARSGAQALALLEHRAKAVHAPYDAVFVDWLMPDIDGWETIAGMHKMGAQAISPITVMVTAHGRDMLSQRSAEEQAYLNAFLIKPLTASMLLDTVIDARAGVCNLRAKPRIRLDRVGRLEGMRVLVVEDNLINQQVARELLRDEGAQVEIAGNGQLGVDAVAMADPPFHAVLMDIQMPVMDGFTATQLIRHTLGLVKLPIIAMTANAMESDREACFEAGMNDHIGKPFGLGHLVGVLQMHTRRGKPGAPPPCPSSIIVTTADATVTVSKGDAPLQHIDSNSAIARLAGNTALYATILRSYLEDLPKQCGQIHQLMLSGDSTGACQLLHALQGVSATVGAVYMSAIAKDAKTGAKGEGSAGYWTALGPTFHEAVENTLRAITPLVQKYASAAPQGSNPSAVGAHDREFLLAELAELQSLFASSDLQALEVHARVHLNFACVAPRVFAELNVAVTNFEFAIAAAHCERLRLFVTNDRETN